MAKVETASRTHAAYYALLHTNKLLPDVIPGKPGLISD